MNDPPLYQALADVVLTLHVGIVAFVIGGLVVIVVGNLRSWRWVNGTAFRLAHLAAIAVVAAEAWLGVTCPLTTLEMWLRTRARVATYDGSFLEHWLRRIPLLRRASLGVHACVFALRARRRGGVVAVSPEAGAAGSSESRPPLRGRHIARRVVGRARSLADAPFGPGLR